ncbi:cytochrome P450 [Sandaracinobacteroides saxicola]|uniref:Cytochrome P450 n=1 Tax=Sandaracinobacteroides saxicola TaxID=2759707 RepID=A0A7G5IKB5_9SPHN|nr:cytochrome P450 [Sandaracinobacteroides saxicola]QMW23807.1 cytochrome P450 [Sandaracinobacteroides saxicola]
MATAYKPSELTLDDLDISRPDLWRDYAILPKLATLRNAGPLHYCPESDFGPYWSVMSHREIVEVESKPDIFSSSWDRGGITIGGRPPEGEEEIRFPMFIAMDRPQHTGQRRTVAPAFTPSEMDRLRASIRGRTATLLDSLPVGEAFDWVDLVSVELTTQMLATLFDFPWEDRRLLPYWSDVATDFDAIKDVESHRKRHEILFQMVVYFQRLWDERKEKGLAPDLISMMINSDATKDMSQLEYLGNLILLIVGGNDTTRNSMTGAVMVQNRYPDQWAKLVANPALIPNATSELIRWQTPLAHMRRTALADTVVAGQTIRAGDNVVMWYLSANREEGMFAAADTWMPDRENARRHLAFGHGIHRCVGARLAELQLGILFEEMLARNMRVRALAEPKRVNNCFVHGYRQLMVEMMRG